MSCYNWRSGVQPARLSWQGSRHARQTVPHARRHPSHMGPIMRAAADARCMACAGGVTFRCAASTTWPHRENPHQGPPPSPLSAARHVVVKAACALCDMAAYHVVLVWQC